MERPETAIVSESFAHKAWGNAVATGKLLKVNGTSYVITAVFEDLPENSIFTCPIILKIPLHGFIAEARTRWDASNYPQFILVKPGTNPQGLNKEINEQSILKSKYRFIDNGKTSATIALIVASITIMKQVHFMQQTGRGFNKGNILVIPMNDGIRNNFNAFRNDLENSPYISQIGCSRAVPGQSQEFKIFTVNGQSCFAWNWAVDDQYMNMMGFKIIKGRGFLKDSKAEDGNFICNETASERYHWKVGTKIGNGRLVGIMKDFNMVSLREHIDPFVFHKSGSYNEFGNVSIKIQGRNNAKALQVVKSAFRKFCPAIPFRGFFLDDHLNLLYVKEYQQAGLITFFGLLSVVVSVFGILGLSIFICQRKIKEIGIRKVNGARVSEILTMLNKDLVKWVVIAFVIATTIVFYAMHKWLERFVYRTNISWWVFALAGVLALGIALLTVSFQSWKAATRNPVKALRYE